MVTLTRILSLPAAGDPSEAKSTDIEMTPWLFAAARSLSQLFGASSRDIAERDSTMAEPMEERAFVALTAGGQW